MSIQYHSGQWVSSMPVWLASLSELLCAPNMALPKLPRYWGNATGTEFNTVLSRGPPCWATQKCWPSFAISWVSCLHLGTHSFQIIALLFTECPLGMCGMPSLGQLPRLNHLSSDDEQCAPLNIITKDDNAILILWNPIMEAFRPLAIYDYFLIESKKPVEFISIGSGTAH